MPPNNKPRSRPEPPGNWVQRLAKVRIARALLQHTHVLQIVEDHRYLWLTAATAEAKRRVIKRMRVQLAWATANFMGLEMTVHGAIASIHDPTQGLALLVVGAAILHITTGGK